ncbi:NAD(P)-binding protein [Calocera viscosa TUFC12733]|uniref:NAD(P)-binding protein n=1 Tax=Calocera viscosa (strain TUFC12733) TaxID=1330018 RepID=A0A167LBG8_CALVF|nr:NAD(P)-binding protein [Calocera viscosa TUFC12733]
MKVLILGATGFIGLPIAQGFVRNGHEVYGSTRQQAKAASLAAEEILPLVGDAWKSKAAEMDVIIDCASAGPGATEYLEIAAAASRERGENYKITYIYASGTWVHGNYENRNYGLADERSPPKTPAELTAWRPAVERTILSHPDVNGVVIRPALLYGKTMSLLEPMFKAAMTGNLEWYGTPRGRYSLIHGDDLADLFVRVGEAGAICKGLTFDGANSQSESVEDILTTLARVAGLKDYSYRKPATAFEVAMCTSGISRPSLARSLFGWVPKKIGLVDGMHIYYTTYVASQNKQDL